MNCKSIQKKLPDFLADMLTESERDDMRDHLADCESCQNHAMKVNSFTGDLKRLGMGELPFDLARSVLAELQSEGSALQNQKEHDLKMILPTVIITILVTLAAVKVFNWYSSPMAETKTSSTISAPVKESQLETLRELQAIDDRLKKTTRSMTSSQNVIGLKPLHSHYEFDQTNIRREFVKKLKDYSPKIIFESLQAIVFSIHREDLETFQAQIQTLPGVSAQKIFDLKKLPESSEPLQVSIVLNLKNHSENFKYWKFEFLRRNSFAFNRLLKEQGFNFIYESSEFWVIQVNEDKFKKFINEAKRFLGLTSQPALDISPLNDSGEIAIAIEE